jgi:uroporphyrinogen decarboxylase
VKSFLKNDLIIRAARGETTERVPVWLMRQAGRVLPEYRATRAKAKNFIEFVKNPELAAEVTVQPVEILGVDAAIIFSDILVIPEAMGLPYQMIESKGPHFEKTVRTTSDIEKIKIADVNELKYVVDAISLAKKSLEGCVPLIGFAGAPWTILAYMVQGSGSKTFNLAKQLLYTNPVGAHQLLKKITQSTIDYLHAQVEAGADMIQLFDSWAGVLSRELYSEFSIPYLFEICDSLSKKVPVTVFAKDGWFALHDIKKLPCQTIGLDWTIEPASGRKIFGFEKTLQGNADPCLLYAPDEVIVNRTIQMLENFGSQRYIANLGHGLYPDLEKEKVKLFVSTVKTWRPIR